MNAFKSINKRFIGNNRNTAINVLIKYKMSGIATDCNIMNAFKSIK